ncbi:MAG: heavy-metal-associated domain-containing protein [Bacteroidetes bacterium]|nr:heavy-metal-associated domain-containing protein [Bacteroidota bacterium]
MKQVQLLLLFIAGFSFASMSQVKRTGGLETATIKTPTVQCEECKKRIEDYVSREQGVQKIVVDYKKKTAKVTYVVDRTSIENVKAAIANIGYDADDVTAEPDAYKRLPKCCKKPEDGGGHEKH